MKRNPLRLTPGGDRLLGRYALGWSRFGSFLAAGRDIGLTIYSLSLFERPLAD
jgi:hypothetical protein